MNCKACGISIDGGYEYKDGYCHDCYHRLKKQGKLPAYEPTESTNSGIVFSTGDLVGFGVAGLVGYSVFQTVVEQMLNQTYGGANIEIIQQAAGIIPMGVVLVIIVTLISSIMRPMYKI